MSTAHATASSGRPAVMRLVPAPRTDPRSPGPDWGDDAVAATTGPYVQGSLAVDFRDRSVDSFFGPQATPTPELPEPGAWARRMIQAVLETYDGTRSADQLSRWVVPEIRERAQRRGQLARRRGRRAHRPPVVRTLLTCLPADGVCEVSAVVWSDGRVRALAVRMCGVDGRWLITAWELG
ncbi:Rv3235 family protein [Ornithinimicrobium cerasi]|uniref:Rv3235 family protein n=1 Tax=Ornithinimicrobium cerasi TaxID=2248773 RepID=UPI000F00457F|nr:Rv3235 family protein [Ornithinimicrobium cerasi]